MKKKILILLGVICFVQPSVAQPDSAIASRFSTITSSLQKSKTLVRLFTSPDTDSFTPCQWKIDCLKAALHDKSPVVVEVACRQIAKMRLQMLMPQLCTLFCQSDKRFMAYSARVKTAIVETFSQPLHPQVRELLQNFLASDNGSSLGSDVLHAVQRINDPELLNAVLLYSKTIETHLQKSRESCSNPFFIFHFKIYRDYAYHVASLLSDEKLKHNEKNTH